MKRELDGAKPDLGPIKLLLARIEEQLHPEQVWLFGSRARGDARPTSDWDLFVVVPDDTEETALEPMEVWKMKRDLKGVYADVIPCRSSDFREWKDTVNTLSYSVATEGMLVYERCTDEGINLSEDELILVKLLNEGGESITLPVAAPLLFTRWPLC